MASSTKTYRLLMKLAADKEISFETAIKINAAVGADILSAMAEGFAEAESAALKAIRNSGKKKDSPAVNEAVNRFVEDMKED